MITSKRNGKSVLGFGLLLALVCFAGCAHTEYGALANRSKEAALSFSPPAGQSGIYVIRLEELEGAAAAFRVNVDEQSLGKISLLRYLYTTLPSGSHDLKATSFGELLDSDDYRFEAEPGKNYFSS
jgi:hypothetical protein